MEKWINSLRYGDEQTKSYIIVVFGLFIATVVFGILCVLNLSWGFGILSVVSGVIAGIILQNISFEDEDVLLKRKIADEQEKEERKEKEKILRQKRIVEKTEEQVSEDEETELEKPGELNTKKKKNKKLLESEKEDADIDEEEADEETEEPYQNYTKEKIEKILYKYKVKEEHRKNMVDFCRKV